MNERRTIDEKSASLLKRELETLKAGVKDGLANAAKSVGGEMLVQAHLGFLELQDRAKVLAEEALHIKRNVENKAAQLTDEARLQAALGKMELEDVIRDRKARAAKALKQMPDGPPWEALELEVGDLAATLSRFM